MDNVNNLYHKLNQFIKKYYFNEIIKGTILSLSIILFSYLVISVSEYYSHFGMVTRTAIFYTFLLILTLCIYGYLVKPLVGLIKLEKKLSYNHAAKIIGKHFPEINDKLLNTLQLKTQNSTQSNSLLEASINQKIGQLNPIPFTKAVDISKNKKYVKFAIPPLVVLAGIFLVSPNILQDSTIRILKHNKYFERPMPFYFNVVNPQPFDVVQYDDYLVEVKVTGEEIPNEAYIKVKGNRYRLKKLKANLFSYEFKNLQSDTKFELFSQGYYSAPYEINVLPKPSLLGFDISINFPKYLNKKAEKVSNIGDITVPEGSEVAWIFDSHNTDQISIAFADTALTLENENGKFTLQKTIKRSERYLISLSNKFLKDVDSIKYQVDIIPDKHPTISVKDFRDSLNDNFLFFTGEIGDDYGFSKLTFNYSFHGENGSSQYRSAKIDINKNSIRERFYHTWDVKKVGIKPGEKISYFFEVWDNDGVNGSKSTKSQMQTFKLPTLDELEQKSEKASKDLKSSLSKTIEESKNIQNEILDLKERLLQKKELTWEDKQAIEDLLDKQQDLQKQVEEIKKQNENYNKQQDELKDEEVDQSLVEKQEELQKLFESVMTDELKELFEEMEDLLEQLNKENTLDNLEDMELSNEELSNELDRMLELFKQLEFDQKLSDMVNDYNKLAEEQKDLAEETGDKTTSDEDIRSKQADINEQLDKLKEEYNDLENLNEELSNPNELEDFEDLEQEISDEIQKSEEQMDNGNNKKSSGHKKNAGQKMEEMAQQLAQMQMDMQMEQIQLDYESLRQILENLISVSFDQEKLIKDLDPIRTNSPQYKKLVQNQHKIKGDITIIKDSLVALSKRVFAIESFVTKELLAIDKNVNKSLRGLEQRRKDEASIRQQYTMTSLNNLAVMLSEVMENMQQEMAQKMSGQQMCQKPNQSGKGKKPNMSSIKKLQEQLNKQMDQMKKGNKPGGNKSKQFAQMAAKQSKIRQMLEKLDQEGNKDGKGRDGNIAKMLEEMNETETELLNKKLTSELMQRQREIMNRLLKAEKAEQEQEQSDERKAEVAKQVEIEIPTSFEEYKRIKEKQMELYKTVPPNLTQYYKHMVEKYFKSISF